MGSAPAPGAPTGALAGWPFGIPDSSLFSVVTWAGGLAGCLLILIMLLLLIPRGILIEQEHDQDQESGI